MKTDIYIHWSELVSKQLSNYQWMDSDFCNGAIKLTDGGLNVFIHYCPDDKVMVVYPFPLIHTFNYFGVDYFDSDSSDDCREMIKRWVQENVEYEYDVYVLSTFSSDEWED